MSLLDVNVVESDNMISEDAFLYTISERLHAVSHSAEYSATEYTLSAESSELLGVGAINGASALVLLTFIAQQRGLIG